MKNIRLTVWIGIMCGWLAAGMLQAGTRPDNARPAEEDGSRLWLPVMRPVEGAEVEVIYKGKVSPTIAVAIAELKNAWKGEPVLLEKKRTGQGDGFAITSSEHQVRILSSTEAGLLYGVYSLLRMQAAGQVTVPLSVTEQSVYDLRILNHWDNLDGTVERGYAGCSLWNWEELPGTLSPRYEAYARANASVGINGTVLNNVNASPQVLATGSLEKAKEMAELIWKIKGEGDTIGGVVSCVIKGCPIGLGQPVFGKLHAALGNAMLSINAVKGFSYGQGFDSMELKGSEQNDVFYNNNGRVETKSNYSGGIQGGISNGQDIYFRVAFKPVATILMEQHTVNINGTDTTMKAKGRHDACVLPRAVPIVEAMAAMTILDYYLIDRTTQL